MKKTFAAIVAAIGLMTFTATSAVSADSDTSWTPPAHYDADVVVGNADAPVTIYEYASLTCPHCRAFQAFSFDAIKKNYIDTGKAKLVYRHYPLDQSALAGALTVQCLPEDKRYQAVKALFSTVEEWAEKQEVVPVLLKEFGTAFTLEQGKSLKDSLLACVGRPGFPEEVLKGMFEADQHGIRSTPYFVINGEHVKGAQSSEAMGKIIEAHLPKAN
jgi:protein-disulfide isomerase